MARACSVPERPRRSTSICVKHDDRPETNMEDLSGIFSGHHQGGVWMAVARCKSEEATRTYSKTVSERGVSERGGDGERGREREGGRQKEAERGTEGDRPSRRE